MQRNSSSELTTSKYANIKLPASVFRDRGVNPDDCALYPVTGDSMTPTIKNGAVVLVNRAKTETSDDDGIYMIQRHDLNGLLQIKQLSSAHGFYRIISHNALYPVEVVHRGAVTIYGEIISQAPDNELESIRQAPVAGYGLPLKGHTAVSAN